MIGSTGFTAEEMKRARELAASVRCVLTPNMSVGVNVMLKVLADVAGILGDDYDVEIVEAHHHLKKDAPSGTALKMAQVIAESLGRDLDQVGVYSRKGMIGERTKPEIGIQTVRAGDIVGEHTVIFGGMGERLEFIHRAHSRDNFARGAIRAALWIVGRENGLYDMQDVLGLKEGRSGVERWDVREPSGEEVQGSRRLHRDRFQSGRSGRSVPGCRPASRSRFRKSRLLRSSSLYRTEPVGPQDQAWFINAVAEIRTGLRPRELLGCLERDRTARWGGRRVRAGGRG